MPEILESAVRVVFYLGLFGAYGLLFVAGLKS